MNPYTTLAIQAFQRQTSLERRLDKAKEEVNKAVRLIPRGGEERTYYYLHTELIRYYADRAEAKRNRDDESVEQLEEMIVAVRRQIKDAEHREQNAQDVSDAMGATKPDAAIVE